MSRPAYEEGYESYCDAGERAPLTPPHRGPKAKAIYEAEEAGREALLRSRFNYFNGGDAPEVEEAFEAYTRYMPHRTAKFVQEAFWDSWNDTAWGFEK